VSRTIDSATWAPTSAARMLARAAPTALSLSVVAGFAREVVSAGRTPNSTTVVVAAIIVKAIARPSSASWKKWWNP